MNAAQLETKLTETRVQIEALKSEAVDLEMRLQLRQALEAELREKTEWLAVRELTCELGTFYAAASPRIPTAGGRVTRFQVGLGLRRVDSGEIELLTVYDVTSYRNRSAHRAYGEAPPIEILMAFEREFKIKTNA